MSNVFSPGAALQKGHSMRPVKKKNGFYIAAKVWVPKNKVEIIGKKQLGKSGTVPFSECPDLNKAKTIQLAWIKELKEFAASSLTYKDYSALYRKYSGEHTENSVVYRLEKELGAYPLSRKLETAFEQLIVILASDNVKRWKNIDGEKRLCNTDHKISEATIKSYKRYHKAICNFASSSNCPIEHRISPDLLNTKIICVGRNVVRKRHIEEWERKKYDEVVGNDYPWFLPLIDFARTMPIRPSDQIEILTERVGSDWHIPYLPQKTAKTGKIARPRVLKLLREYVNSRRTDIDCPYLFFKPGNIRQKEDPKRNYKLSYWNIDAVHGTVCKRAGIKDLQFYDWRHDAVNYLLSIGFSRSQIMAFAGWSTDIMVDQYDTEDPNRLSAICDVIEQEAASRMKAIVLPFKQVVI